MYLQDHGGPLVILYPMGSHPLLLIEEVAGWRKHSIVLEIEQLSRVAEFILEDEARVVSTSLGRMERSNLLT